MTPFVDAPDKFIWRWVNLDNTRIPTNMSLGESLNFAVLPPFINAVKSGDVELVNDLLHQGMFSQKEFVLTNFPQVGILILFF